MSPINKRKFAFWGLVATVALSLCIVGFADNDPVLFKGETTTRTCGSIYYGNTKPSSYPSTNNANIDAFTVINLPTATASGSGFVSKGSTGAGEAIKLGSSSNSGSITFTFASSISIYDAYFYACATGSAATVTVTTGSDTSTTNVSVSSTTAPSVCNPATAGDLSSYAVTGHVVFDVTTATTTLSISCTSGKPIYLFKIVLSIGGSGSGSSSSSSESSSSTSSSESTSSSTTTTGTYQLVTKQSQIAVGGVYVIGNAKAAGSGYFLGSTTTSSYYRANVSGTINSDLTTTPASGVQTLTLGGSSSAYTFATSSSYLASNASYTTDLIFASSVNTWTISFDSSTYACAIANVETGAYVEYTSSYFDCNSSSSSVYLYVQKGSVGQELTLSSSSLSLAKDATDSSVTVSATGFSGTPTYSVVPNNSSICSGSVSGSSLSVTGLAAGTTQVTVTATYGTDETASAIINVIVSNASGSYVTIDNTSLTLYVGWDSGTINATSYNFSGTVTFAAASSSGSATVTINSSTGVATVTPASVGSSTITITASNGSESATATCAVTVEAAPTPTLTLSTTSLNIVNGSYGTITATAENFGGTAVITASSSNTAAATVSVSSTLVTVTGQAIGTATVTVTATYSTRSKTATCAVSVINTDATTTEYNPWRIAPQTSSTTTANVYTVSYSNGMYRGSVTKTLTKNSEYTTNEDVAAYYQAFKGYPSNYSTSISYTGNQRLISNYTRAVTSNTGYLANINTTRNGEDYIELDIATAGSTSYKSSSSRGVLRVVVFPAGFVDYGTDTVAFYTSNHYKTFQEYYNCYGNWGSAYLAEGTASTYPTALSQRAKPTTVKFLAS